MTLEERLDSLYPEVEQFTKEEIANMRSAGMPEETIRFLQSRAMMANMTNYQLREAYLLGRAEKDLYDNEQ